MPTQTYSKWTDPVVEREGIDQNEPPRKKQTKKHSFLHCTIKLTAFLVILAVAGNVIEFIARL